MGNRIIENSQNSGVRLFSIESSVAKHNYTHKQESIQRAHYYAQSCLYRYLNMYAHCLCVHARWTATLFFF